MKFCTVCEKPLDFLEFLDGELCAACRLKERPAAKPAEHELDIETLLDATLSVSGDKVELRSPEGGYCGRPAPGSSSACAPSSAGPRKFWKFVVNGAGTSHDDRERQP